MPEIKSSFLQGKMNKDLDERLLPNGQYRDALNVEVSTSEDSNVGVVKNVLGNYRVEDVVDSSLFTCVGSIGDEKTNRIYWFVSSASENNQVDAIIEYDIDNDVAVPVLVDTNAGNYKAVLKFSGNIITGINIIDNLLFWTDNNSEPKKINITDCKIGTPVDALENLIHTQLRFDSGSFNGITIELTTSVGGASISDALKFVPGSVDNRNFGRNAWVETKQLSAMLGEEDGEITNGGVHDIRLYRDGKFLGVKEIRAYSDSNGTYITENVGADHFLFNVNDVVFGNNITTDIEEKHITVIKPKPTNTLSIKVNHSDDTENASSIPNLFETKLPRFSYRYKYVDGEYSAFAPFTAPVFNPKYPKDPSVSFDTSIFYNKDNAYDIKEPYNKAMINSIHSIELSDFITAKTPEDVVEIDILYKQEESNVIYSINTIKHVDKEWHYISNHEGLGLFLGVGKGSSGGAYNAIGGYTKGRYTVTTENIYAALPANQLLRPWDNVPRKALAQEITGNRIVYGNYVQNYDLINNTKISVSYNDRKNNINNFTTHGLASVKSQRNYQLGVVYCDKYGRETPVFTSIEGAVYLPWQDSSGNKNASKNNQLNAKIVNNFPEWVDSLKFFVKENSSEYYNLAMERAWVTQSTYDLDNSEGHIWLSFPSSDRNKLSEEDYIILKKKIGTGEDQVSFENKFKVIDIKNEAPDAIKYELVRYGTIVNDANDSLTIDDPSLPALFDANAGEYWPDHYNATTGKGTQTLKINISHWDEEGLNIPLENDASAGDAGSNDVLGSKDLYISWFRNPTSGEITSSKKYKIIGGQVTSTHYILNLSTPITREDADVAHAYGDSTQQSAAGADENNVSKDPTVKLHADLTVKIEKKELKDSEDFSGKFFVKISKNQVVDLVTDGNPVNILDQYQVKAKSSSWYWQDDIDSDIAYNSGSHGLTNYDGFTATHTTTDSIHHEDNNSNGTAIVDNKWDGATVGGGLEITDYHTPWANIRDETFGPTFFIDSMHMAAGQSEASDFAKYCCVTWSGCTKGEDGTLEDSAWSYPPLKTWLGEFNDTSNVMETLKDDSVWYNNNLISTSPIMALNPNWNDFKVDGWVGPLQRVDRHQPVSGSGLNGDNHINGLEGLVTTTESHSVGPRRWFSGITGNPTEHGVGVDTKTYSTNEETDRHFMHLSFFAPGKDLHSGPNDFDFTVGQQSLYGDGSWAANLQGIWGGGVFTGWDPDQRFGSETSSGGDGHLHLAMEGNYDVNDNPLEEPAAPGVGFGYDTDYRELHERQWDPTFNKDGDPNNRIRDFIRNLHAGAKFRFNRLDNPSASVTPEIDETVYTIKSVKIKKLYNHTSWRKTHNRFKSGEGYGMNNLQEDGVTAYTPNDFAYQSVEETALVWLDQLPDVGYGGANANGEAENLKNKIVQFGASHNRRLCYIIELDQNPEFSDWNPLNEANVMTADYGNNDFCNIEFLDPVVSPLLSDLSKFPAIWEVDPKKKDVDLDIYYEASDNIPVRLNERTSELFAPLGCKVEVLNSSVTGSSILESWENDIATFYPGFPKGDAGGNEINYTGMSFKFIREDGSYTIAEAGEQDLDGGSSGYKVQFPFREDIGETITTGLDWYNCFSFGNGVESNRIKDDFNEVFITNGVKASTTTQETYKEERRKSGLIYSGIYNSNSGVNDLNQFIMAEKITKDLNPTYGSIQKLFQRRISLIAFCEDRVIQITSNKDAIYNADGNPQLISSNNVLGDANPFVGDYGISKNPESFASQSYRAYFTDRQRGAVLRLSKDGLTPISNIGMTDWFRDNLQDYNALIGTYDSYKEDYNLTLSNNPSFFENLIFDTYLETGDTLGTLSLGAESRISNPGVFKGVPYRPLHMDNIVDQYGNPNNPFDWDAFTEDDYDLSASVNIVHHAEILAGALQPLVGLQQTGTGDPGNPFTFAEFFPVDSNAPDSGWFYDATFDSSSPEIFGNTAYNNRTVSGANNYDVDTYSYISRQCVVGFSNSLHVSQEVNEDSPSGQLMTLISTHTGTATSSFSVTNVLAARNGSYQFNFPMPDDGAGFLDAVTEQISRNDGTGTGTVAGAITFDRPTNELLTFVEFRDIGRTGFGLDGHLMDAFAVANGQTAGDIRHRSFYNGDEIHVQLTLRCYLTKRPQTDQEIIDAGGNPNPNPLYGYNYIKPTIKLMDGANQVPNDDIAFVRWSAQSQSNNATYDPYLYYQTNYGSTGFTTSSQTTYGSSGTLLAGWGTRYEELSPGVFHNRKTETSMFCSTSSKEWASTQYIQPINENASASVQQNSVDVVLFTSFKFQDKTGAYSGLTNNYGAGVEVVEAKVVDDLRIRVYNSLEPSTLSVWGTGTDDDNSYGEHPMRAQFWEIKSLKIKKGFGVTAPHLDPQLADPFVTTQHAVDKVPPVDVPAWDEIIYPANYGFGSNSWKLNENGVAPWNFYTEGQDKYGEEHVAVGQVGLLQNTTDITQAPTQQISYVVPQNWGYGTNDYSILNNNALVTPGPTPGSSLPIIAAANFSRKDQWNADNTNYAGSYPFYTEAYDNDYIHIQSAGSGSSVDVRFNILNDPWQIASTWYLVDIEFDDSYGAGANVDANNLNTAGFGVTPGGGIINIAGAAPSYVSSGAVQGDVIDPNGVGTYTGGLLGISSVRLLQKTRTEYGNPDGTGDNEIVLRAIFQVDSTSEIASPVYSSSPQNEFILRFHGISDGVKVKKIITKKLSNDTGGKWTDWVNTNSKADNWVYSQGIPNSSNNSPDEVKHAFDAKTLYYKNSALNWNTPTDTTPHIYKDRWYQILANPPVIDDAPWELSFVVEEAKDLQNNPIPFSGKLQGYVSINDSTNTGIPQGLRFNNITQVGRYKLRFTFNDDINTQMTENGQLVDVWKAERADLGLDNYALISPPVIIAAWNHGSPLTAMVNTVWFTNADGTVPSRWAIKNIKLTNSTSVFTGGSAGSWNFDGFNTSINDYIYWDVTTENLKFLGCPAFEAGLSRFINVNQYIVNTINQHEQYNISFQHTISTSTATLSIYYYNHNGYGFKISNIGPTTYDYNGTTENAELITSGPNAGAYRVSQNVRIGDSVWDPINIPNTFDSNLRNSFVIEVQGGAGELITGSIDNISMTRVLLDIGDVDNKTITFNEAAKGWVSFKDFIPENGLSVSKKYFTFDQGCLYQHYVPLKIDTDSSSPTSGGWITGKLDDITGNFVEYTAQEAENYNRFYGVTDYKSSIQAILNQEPSLVKTFNTLNYEGSQAYVIKPTNAILPNGDKAITLHNIDAWQNGDDIKGWNASVIKTDLDSGSVIEFIKKEGKWFNYIKGKNTDNNTIDTSLLSVQGVGIIAGVNDL